MAGKREVIAATICKSRKFETGQGACAVICMDQLGDVRAKGCAHAARVHGALADQIEAALAQATGGEDVR